MAQGGRDRIHREVEMKPAFLVTGSLNGHCILSNFYQLNRGSPSKISGLGCIPRSACQERNVARVLPPSVRLDLLWGQAQEGCLFRFRKRIIMFYVGRTTSHWVSWALLMFCLLRLAVARPSPAQAMSWAGQCILGHISTPVPPVMPTSQ